MKKILSFLTAAVIMVSCVYVPVHAASGQNIALNKPVTATSEWGGAYRMECVNDGKLNTSWSIGSTRLNPKDSDGNDWIQIDLGGRYDITSMIAYSRSDVNSAGERMGWIYQVSETADFTEKTVIGTKKNAGNPGAGYEAKPVEPVTGRYVRVACASYFVIAEIEVYGTPAAAAAKGEYNDIAQEGDLYNASQLAYTLGIIEEGVGGGDFGVNHLMTRAEAAEIAAKLGKSGELKPADTGFTDVNADSKRSGYIAWCENSMVISKGGEFRPDDYVTGTEFAAMLLRLNGWWETMGQGKYPDIVHTLAEKSDLLEGVDIVPENDLNRGQALLMIQNLLLNKMIKAVGVDQQDGVIYEKGDLYLYEMFGYELEDGIVTSNLLSDLVEPNDGSEDYVTVDDVQYHDTTGKVTAFLGERVWYLFDSEKEEIMGAWRNPDIGSSVTIQCDRIQDSDESSVFYWEDGRDMVQKLRLEEPVYFIKNGVASGNYTPGDLKRTNGKLVLIDNDGDKKYEVIKLYEPQVMVLEYLNESGGKLALGGKENASFVSEKHEVISAYLNGFATDYKEIGGGVVAYIYRSDDGRYVELEFSSGTAEGTLEKIVDDVYVIDGVKYELSQYYIKNKDMMDIVKAGAEAKFLLDANGMIVWAVNDNITVSPETLGVIYAMANPDGFGNYRFKVYNQNNEHLELTAADDVIVDGKKCGVSDVGKLGSDYFIGKAVIYKLNSAGKIRWLDTENYNVSDEPDSWLIKQDKWSLPSGSLRNAIGFYDSNGKTMVMPFYEDYKVFNLPKDSGTGALIKDSKLLDRYSYKDMSSLFPVNDSSGTTGTFTFYGLSNDESPRLAVRTTNTSTTLNVKPVTAYTSNSVLVVESVGAFMDGDMESYFISGYNPSTGLEVTVNLPHEIDSVLDSYIIYINKANSVSNPGISFTGLNYVSSTASTDLASYSSPVDDLNLGDVLRYEISDGLVTALERIYANEEGSPSLTYNGMYINTGDNYSHAHRAGFRAVSNNIAKLEDGILSIGSESFKYNDTNAESFILIENGEITAESIDLLPVYMEKNDRMLMISLSGKVSYLIAYK